MVRKYLLTTGETTTKVEDYIIDLFRLYLTIYPGDIPYRETLGVNFNLAGTLKDELPSKLEIEVNSLIDRIRDKVGNATIEIESLKLIDEGQAELVLKVNQKVSDNIIISL